MLKSRIGVFYTSLANRIEKIKLLICGGGGRGRKTDGQTVSQTDRETDRQADRTKGGPTDTSSRHDLIDLSGDPDQ